MTLHRITRVLLLAGLLTGCVKSALVEPPVFPTEVDTLVAMAEGDLVSPGDVLLVRRGAELNIGSDTIGAEQHGNRWVKFE